MSLSTVKMSGQIVKGLIYKIVIKISNSINAIYIGQTIRKFEERKRQHIYNINDKTRNTPLYDTMRHYGIDACTFQIIEENLPITQLDDRERHWIKEYNTLFSKENKYGLNYKDGGNSHDQWTEELRAKQSDILKKYFEDPVAREQNRQRQIEVYQDEDLRQLHRDKRQEFLESEEGKIWKETHSKHMLDRANSEEGIAQHQAHSEFMKTRYETAEGIAQRQAHSQKHREFMNSPEGAAFKARMSEHAKKRMAARRALIPKRHCSVCNYTPPNNSSAKFNRHTASSTHKTKCMNAANRVKCATLDAFFN